MTKILIVDDEQKNLYLLQTLLGSSGYEVISALNGAEALELAGKDKPDVIVSDILMPVMDGFSFCRACKADAKLKKIPFIFYTATYTDPKDEDLALSLGAERFIVKPTEPAEFLSMLNETVKKYTTGKVKTKQALMEEEQYLEKYSSALIRKLEEKVAELEEKNRKAEEDKFLILKSEEMLKESEERFRYAFDFAPIGKALISLDGHFLKVNVALAELLGYTEDEMLQMTSSDVTHPEDADIQKTLSGQLLSGEIERFQIEKRCICKDRQVISILFHMSLVREKSGKPLYFIVQIQDITERKRADEEIKRHVARAEALLRTSNSINSDLDLPAVLQSICEETSRALDIPSVAIYQYDPESDTFNVIVDFGLPEVFNKAFNQIHLKEFPPELSIFENTPIILPDTREVKDFPLLSIIESLGIRTIVVSRLENKKNVIGALVVYSIGEERHITEQEIELLTGLSNQASQAISNSNLYENIKLQLRNIEALHTIDKAITSSMDIDITLMLVVDNALRQLNVDAADILLFNVANNQLETKVIRGFSMGDVKKSVRLGEGLAGQIALEWKRIFLKDFADYPLQIVRKDLFDREKFVSYCGVALRSKGEFLGVLEVFSRSRMNPDQDWFDFIDTLGGQAAIAIDNIKSYDDLQSSNKQLIMAYDATIEGWSRAMDIRDRETEGHTQRVAQLSIQLAKLLGINDGQIVHLRRGALLHDMGKLGIPDSILLKPDKLTDDEWDVMRRHPQLAYDMLYRIDYLRPALEIPYCHHEKWDGSGYPRGLKGEEIPLSARIFAVVDVWDALTSDRPYRGAWTQEKASEYIKEQSGKHFDPRVVNIFLSNSEKLIPQVTDRMGTIRMEDLTAA